MAGPEQALLQIEDLSAEFRTYQGVTKALNRVNLHIEPGEILGLVGESGCGKSVTARSILRLIPDPPYRITSGRIIFKGQDVLNLSTKKIRQMRGNAVSLNYQEPMASLNQVFTVGNQMLEVVNLHQQVGRSRAREVCLEMLNQVKLPDAEQILSKYPHELSGGMRQRVMIAMELSCRPDLLIADEPTTALDVTIQGQVLTILAELTRKKGFSVLFITHDMSVIAQLCDRVAVMYAGVVVEIAGVKDLFAAPRHPYTKGLIDSIAGLEEETEHLEYIPGVVPNLIDPPEGCRFHPRCGQKMDQCSRLAPELVMVEPKHYVACHLFPG
ncbi:MAG: ABC transporter ATP-binding protein [Deltaproteobacteria bacterium]|nr:ABC transporter ATP-binding protein [Deltaproteobacteria bacterium]